MRAIFRLLFFLLGSIGHAQNCIPSDECANAPRLCMNGLIVSTQGYTGSGIVYCNPSAQIIMHNDCWIAFVPTQSNLTINVSLLGTCTSGEFVDVLVHSSCTGAALECFSCYSSIDVGGSITFIPGQTYYIRIDGCDAAVCSVQLNVSPANAIALPPDRIQPKWPPSGLIAGPNPIECFGKEGTYTLPLSTCATSYTWTIESGNAQIIQTQPDNYIDNNPAQPGTNITMTGSQRNKVKVKFFATGTVRLCAIGTDGCFNTNKTCVDIVVKRPPDVIRKVNICATEAAYDDPDLPGGPFPPRFPCKNAALYDVIKIDAKGCEYTVKLSVTQLCDSVFNLGEIPLCPGERFSVCGTSFDSTNAGPQEIICYAKPRQNANANPPNCDSTKTFTILPIDIKPIVSPLYYKLPCPDSKVNLDGNLSSWSPTNAQKLKSVLFQWQKLETVPDTIWRDLVGASNKTYVASSAGKYRLRISLVVNYLDEKGVSRTKSCASLSKEIVVDSSDSKIPSGTSFLIDSIYCFNQLDTLSALNPDSTVSYLWYNAPKNDTLSLLQTLIIAPTLNNQIICLQAVNGCNQKSASFCDTLRVIEEPIIPNVSGALRICQGSTNVYCLTNPISETSYTWAVPTPATFNPGPGPNCITVNWPNNALPGNISITAKNICAERIRDIAIRILGLPGDITGINGPTDVCITDTSKYFGTYIDTTNASFKWILVPSGIGNIVGPDDQDTVSINWIKTGDVSVKLVNPCGEGQFFTINVKVKLPPIAPVVTGAATLCAGTKGVTYTIDTLRAGVTYLWSVSSGGVITAGQGTKTITVDWNTFGPQVVSVVASNECGAPKVDFPVTVNQVPTANAGVAQQICGFNGTFAAVPSVGSGSWKLISGPVGGLANIANSTTPNSPVSVTVCGAYVFQWTEDNFSCLDSARVTLDYSEPPIAVSPKEVCDKIDFSYTVSFDIVGCKPPYKIFDATTGLQVGTAAVAPYKFTTAKIGNEVPYNFVIQDAFGCFGDTLKGKRKCDCTTKADTINTTTILQACENQTITGISLGGYVNDGNDIKEFVLHNGSGALIDPPILGINKTGTFGFNPLTMQYNKTYYISPIAGNQIGVAPNDNVDLNEQCLQVSPGQPVVWRKNPIPDAGITDAICGKKYTFKATADVGTGTWKLKSGPGGATATYAPQGSPSATVTVPTFGTYVFTWEENNFGCIGSDDVTITFKPDDLAVATPAQPFVKADYECDPTTEFYRITLTFSGGTAPYRIDSLPGVALAPIVGNSYTSFWIPTQSHDTIYVRDASECTLLTIPLYHVCDCISDAQGVTIQNQILCEFDTLKLSSAVIKDANDIVEYVISSAQNVKSNPGSILQRNATGRFTLDKATMECGKTYYASVIVGNEDKANLGTVNFADLCSDIITEPVLYNCQPKALPGASDTICDLSYNILGDVNVGNVTWTQLSGPGSTTFGSPGFKQTAATVNQVGLYTYLMAVNNNGCRDSATISISYGQQPVVAATTEVNDYTTGFSVTLDITKGMMPYTVSGKGIVGNKFIGDSIKCALGVSTPYSYLVVDAFGCETLVTGSEKCECLTDAGTLNPTEINLCSDQKSPVIKLPADMTLIKKDVYEFLLAEECGPKSAKKILDRNKTGSFGYLPGMQYDKNYYITLIAGDSLGNGQVSFADICLDSAACMIIRFVELPRANAGSDDKVCGLTYTLGGSLSLAAGKSIGNWSFVSGPGTADFGDGSNPKTDVTVSVCGTYRFRFTEINNGCANSDTVEIIFSQPPTLTPIDATCNNIYTNYTVKFKVEGCGAPYIITGMNGGTLVGDVYTANPIASATIDYSFSVTDVYGCKQILSGSLDCNCKGTLIGDLNAVVNKVCVNAQGQGTVSAELTNNTLDANDTYMYILTDKTPGIGTILATYKSGVFGFNAGTMQYDKTYYIVGAIGDSLPNGNVDLSAANKCLLSKSVPVVFRQKPVVTCPAAAVINCKNSYQLNAGSNVGNTEWTVQSSPAGTFPSFLPNSKSGTATVTVNDTGTYVLLWKSDNQGCTDECTVTLNFKEYPAPKYTPLVYDCNKFGQDTAYVVTFTLSGNPPFTLLPGSSAGAINGNQFTSAPIKSSLPYKFIIKDSRSCDSTVIDGDHLCDCKAEAGTPLPTIQICEGIDTTIQLRNLLVGEEPGGVWSVNPTSPAFNAAAGTFNTKTAGPNEYIFTYTISPKFSAPPCDGDTSRIQINVNPTPKADAGLDQGLGCKVVQATLGGSATTIDPALDYNWSGRLAAVKDSKARITTVIDSGTFILTVRYPQTGCLDRDTVVISKTITEPKINTTQTNPLCTGEKNGAIILKISGGKAPYIFDFKQGNGDITGVYTKKTDSLQFKFLSAGAYPMVVEDSNGCVVKKTIVITDPPQLEIEAGDDVTIDLGDSKQLFVDKNYPIDLIDTILWVPAPLDSFQTKVRDTLTVSPKEGQLYCVTVITKLGCKATDCVRVSIDKKRPIYIPNVFRPDDADGALNARFMIFANNKYVSEIQDFEIFNRWGDIMYKLNNFQPNDPALGWDGTFRGKPLDPGVYVYWAKVKFVDGTVEVFKGDVTLIR